MNREAFESVAVEMWERIPGEFRAGVEALVVEGDAVPHSDLEGVFTLGECVTDFWPSAYSEEGGDVRSRVVLYHGSFRSVEGRDPALDWEEEIWETLLHELLHHREFAASESALEAYDRAVDENFKRHAGRSFDPSFYRAVPTGADGTVRIESEMFVEGAVGPDGDRATFGWRDGTYAVRIPETEDVLYVNPRNLADGRLWVVIPSRRPWWRRLWTALSGTVGDGPGVEHLHRRAEPAPSP